jgi:DNA-binding MarR family transcriptional regulator
VKQNAVLCILLLAEFQSSKILVDTTILKRYISNMSKIKTTQSSTLQAELGVSQPFQVLEQEVYLNLVRTHALLSDEVAELFKQHHLSQPLYNVLKVVARVGEAGMPSQSIAQYMVARDPDITRLVDRLQKDRLIERERDESDRRVVLIRVTSLGIEVIQKLDPLIWELHRQQLGHLSPKKLELLNQLLVEARCKP